MDKQAHDRAVNEARQRWQAHTNRALSDRVSALANEPRRYSPIEREALLRTVASRLWKMEDTP